MSIKESDIVDIPQLSRENSNTQYLQNDVGKAVPALSNTANDESKDTKEVDKLLEGSDKIVSRDIIPLKEEGITSTPLEESTTMVATLPIKDSINVPVSLKIPPSTPVLGNVYRPTYDDLESLASLDSDPASATSNHVNPIPQPDLENGLSQNKSTASVATIVPRSNRRGIFSFLVVIPEYEDARDYPNSYKYVIVFIIAFALMSGPMGSSIILPAINDIAADLNTQVSIVNLCVGTYLLSLGIFPLWWSALSERNGRRNVYLVSFVLFFVFSVACALSPSIGALIGFRVLQGGCSASVQALGAGTIGDLFRPEQRGTAMGYFYLGPLCGPFFAPILGGVVAQAWGWRATQWLLVIVAGINCIFIIFILPETLRKGDNLAAIREMLAQQQHDYLTSREKDSATSALDEAILSEEQLTRIATNLSRRSSLQPLGDDDLVLDAMNPTVSRYNTNRSAYLRKLQKELLEDEVRKTVSQLPTEPETKWDRIKDELYQTLIRPTKAVVLLSHPQIWLVILYASICFGIIYFFNLTISYKYSRLPYNFSSIIVGLLYIPNSITYVIALIIGGRWNDRLVHNYARDHDGEFFPEARLSWNIVLAVICYVPACLIFGWTIKYGEMWVIPLIGTALSGFASMLVIGATATYLVDSLPGKGATGVALNNLVRQIFAAIASFVVEPLLRAIGPGVLFSICAGLIVVFSGCLVVLKRKGNYIRDHYDLAKLYDKL